MNQTLNVLYFEDSMDYAYILKRYLEKDPNNEYSIEHHDSLVKFKAQLGANCYDLIISDLHLDNRDIFNTLSFLKENFPQTPVVIATGLESNSLKRIVEERNGFNYFCKDDIRKDFYQKIQSIIKGKA